MSAKNRLISRKIDKAIFEFNLIEPGDKILIAVSGGKDSLTLAYFLGKKQNGFPIPFTAEAIYIQSDFDGCAASPQMETLLSQWEIPFHVVDVPVVARLKPGKSLNCYWCSTQRRMELLRYANEHGFNKIALGHHLDDIIETFFMNLFYKSEMSTMMPLMLYDKYPQSVIRPLARVQESEIIKFARNFGFLEQASTCPYGTTSKRLDIKKLISTLPEEEGSKIRENIFNAMGNVNLKYLPHRIVR